MTVFEPKQLQTDDSTCKWLPDWKCLHSKWAGLLVVAAIFIFMAALSWRKWADIVVDFGMQLYVPWRLSEGDVLYRDVMYLPGGPFSQYFNALLFKIFGVSFRTLIFANLTITAAMLVLIYRQFLAAADRWTATTITSIIVVGFAFANYGDANYNYIAPYCHEALHGLALSVLAIALLTNWIQKRRITFIFFAGLCYGIVFLTKPEIFLALSVVTAAAFALILKDRGQWNFIAKSFAAFAAAALVMPLFFLFYFLRIENWHNSFNSIAFAWVPPLQHPFAHDAYYQKYLGLDHPLGNLWRMTWQFAAIVLVIIFYAAFFRRKIISSRDRIIAVAITAPLLAIESEINWSVDVFLPLVSLTLCVLLWLNSKKMEMKNRFAFPFLWSVSGLALLAKMGLFSRIWHYGFVLGMQAFAGMIYLLLWLLPSLFEKYGVQRQSFRRLAWCAIVFIGLQLLTTSASHYRELNFAVRSGGDKIFAANTNTDSRGQTLAAAMTWLDTNAPHGATLAVVPEGAMANYLTRRVNPTHYPVWMPPEMETFGQTNMINAFEQQPPDYVILLHRSINEYNLGYFGVQPEYGLSLMQWIRQNYKVEFQENEKALQNGNFGLQILKRRSMPETLNAKP